MSRTGKQDHVQIITFDDSVAVNKHKVLSRHCSPVSDNLVLDHVSGKRFLQKRVVQQIQLSSSEVVCRIPVVIHSAQKVIGDRPFFCTLIRGYCVGFLRHANISFRFESVTSIIIYWTRRLFHTNLNSSIILR